MGAGSSSIAAPAQALPGASVVRMWGALWGEDCCPDACSTSASAGTRTRTRPQETRGEAL